MVDPAALFGVANADVGRRRNLRVGRANTALLLLSALGEFAAIVVVLMVVFGSLSGGIEVMLSGSFD